MKAKVYFTKAITPDSLIKIYDALGVELDGKVGIKVSTGEDGAKGYDERWIAKRIKSVQDRKELTDVWKDGGITESKEYAILTNEIYKEWSGMTAKQYKSFKGLRKESLRDNMTDVEVALADLGEIATREIAKKKNPKGLNENIEVARRGGKIAGDARKDLEHEIGESVVTNANALNYQYVDEREIEMKN